MDANATAYSAMLEKYHCSNCFRVTAENDRLRRRVTDMEVKPGEAVASLEQVWAKVSSLREERDALAAKGRELPLEVQYMPSSAKEAKSLARVWRSWKKLLSQSRRKCGESAEPRI